MSDKIIVLLENNNELLKSKNLNIHQKMSIFDNSLFLLEIKEFFDDLK